MTTRATAVGADVSGRVDSSSPVGPHRAITSDVPTLITSPESETLDGSLETELLDLSGVSLSALRLIDDIVLNSSVHRILEQVDRPRVNLGGSGPPGRVD